MTPEITADSPGEAPKQAPSTAGMTTKVVKGSMWTLAGSVAPLAVSFISTPFIIRFLGTESYGVLLLVGLIPTYFSFADFGMGVASTKFASEAYGQGDEKKEAEVVWTATAIAAISALIVAVPLFLFSYPIVKLMNVPEHLLSTASVALKITSGSFFLGILSSVLNSPMLARLRMDLNMLTSATPKILLATITPFILYFGGGIVEAVGWAFVVAVGTLAIVICFSARLLPRLTSFQANREFISLLVKFGRSWFLVSVSWMLLANMEKFVLTGLVSVKALAYYSVAFTVANAAALFSWAMLQSLIPAFAGLLGSGKREEFDALLERSFRLNVLWFLPLIMVMFLAGESFFYFWAGADFARESTLPFHILLAGLLLSLSAPVPYAALIALGQTRILAKVQWLEVVFYAILLPILISNFGIVGAAAAWSLRVMSEATLLLIGCGWVAKTSFGLAADIWKLLLAVAVLAVPLVLQASFDGFSIWFVILIGASLAGYSFLAWTRLISATERNWLMSKVRQKIGFA